MARDEETKGRVSEGLQKLVTMIQHSKSFTGFVPISSLKVKQCVIKDWSSTFFIRRPRHEIIDMIPLF